MPFLVRKKMINSISDNELVYRDPTGGLSILHTENLTVRILMTNSTFVSVATECRSFDHRK